MIKELWSTPILQIKMPDSIRESLINRIFVDYDLKNPPSDFGKSVLENQSKEFQDFKNDVIYPAFNAFLEPTLGKNISSWSGHRMNAWLAGTGYDYSINFHNHRGAQVSAVFYLLCEEQDAGGEVFFSDPRMNANRGYDEAFNPWFKDLVLKPKSGDIVIFPSFLYHFVTTYHGNIRVAMPVDLFLHTNK